MTPLDLDIAAHRAVATSRDFPEDYEQPTAWNVCGDCNRIFRGLESRIQCRLCAGRRTL